MASYNLRGVIFRNMYRSRRQYLGYLIAVVLAVATFFSFGFFLLHPDLQKALSSDVSSALGQLLIIGQVGVALFAFFFVTFFHRFLLRLRAKEFGLLTTLGISPKQLQRMVRIESLLLAIIALVVGMVLAFGEAAVLFQLIAKPLQVPALEAKFSPAAILYGLAFFGVLFALDTYFSTRSLRNITPKQLLTTSKVAQMVPQVSRAKIGLGAVSIAVAYGLALGFQSAGAGLNTATMLPIVILVAVGTYLFFSQSMVWLLGRLRRTTKSGLTLLSTSRLAHRSSDFARVLTIVSLLNAGVLTLVGVALGVLSHLRQVATSQAELAVLTQVFTIVLFVFFFLAFLFLVAALSTLYVKLFTQVDEDRRQFDSLRRIGLFRRDMKTMISGELAVLFFAPAIIAILHALAAMGEFTTKIAPKEVSDQTAWLYFMAICGGYLVCMTVYFWLARWKYSRAVS